MKPTSPIDGENQHLLDELGLRDLADFVSAPPIRLAMAELSSNFEKNPKKQELKEDPEINEATKEEEAGESVTKTKEDSLTPADKIKEVINNHVEQSGRYSLPELEALAQMTAQEVGGTAQDAEAIMSEFKKELFTEEPKTEPQPEQSEPVSEPERMADLESTGEIGAKVEDNSATTSIKTETNSPNIKGVLESLENDYNRDKLNKITGSLELLFQDSPRLSLLDIKKSFAEELADLDNDTKNKLIGRALDKLSRAGKIDQTEFSVDGQPVTYWGLVETNKEEVEEETETDSADIDPAAEEIVDALFKTPESKVETEEMSSAEMEDMIEGLSEEFGDAEAIISKLEQELNNELAAEAGSALTDQEISEFLNPKISPEAEANQEASIRESLEKLPVKDKERLGLGLATIGFKTSSLANNFFKNITDKFVARQADGTWLKSRLSGLSSYYGRREHLAKQQLEKGENRSWFEWAGGAGKVPATILRLARIGHGLNLANPVRLAMIGSMTAGFVAETEKRSRALDNQRIKNADLAQEEANKILAAAEARAGGREMTAADFKLAYTEALRSDLAKRLEGHDLFNSDFLRSVSKRFISSSFEKINNKFKDIDGDSSLSEEVKEAQKDNLMRRYEAKLEELNGLIKNTGEIDSLAYLASLTEKSAKWTTTALTLETLGELGYKSIASLESLFSSSDTTVSAAADLSPETVVSAAGSNLNHDSVSADHSADQTSSTPEETRRDIRRSLRHEKLESVETNLKADRVSLIRNTLEDLADNGKLDTAKTGLTIVPYEVDGHKFYNIVQEIGHPGEAGYYKVEANGVSSQEMHQVLNKLQANIKSDSGIKNIEKILSVNSSESTASPVPAETPETVPVATPTPTPEVTPTLTPAPEPAPTPTPEITPTPKPVLESNPSYHSPNDIDQTLRSHLESAPATTPEVTSSVEAPVEQVDKDWMLYGPAPDTSHLEYQGGRSVWSEASKQLAGRFHETFTSLGGSDPKAAEALETYNIDQLKDTIMANPSKYGLPEGFGDTFDARRTTKAMLEAVDWDQAFKDSFPKGLLTENLTEAQIDNIVSTNAALRGELSSAHSAVESAPTPAAATPEVETVPESVPTSHQAPSNLPVTTEVGETPTTSAPTTPDTKDWMLYSPEDSATAPTHDSVESAIPSTDSRYAKLQELGLSDQAEMDKVIDISERGRLSLEKALAHPDLLDNHLSPEARAAAVKLMEDPTDKISRAFLRGNYPGEITGSEPYFFKTPSGAIKEGANLYYTSNHNGTPNLLVHVYGDKFSVEHSGWPPQEYPSKSFSEFLRSPRKFIIGR